jgi:hypothetical protein
VNAVTNLILFLAVLCAGMWLAVISGLLECRLVLRGSVVATLTATHSPLSATAAQPSGCGLSQSAVMVIAPPPVALAQPIEIIAYGKSLRAKSHLRAAA